ncbi:hypothetical protein BDF21DRAFT_458577 [Thamnidium elegans]|nr:hypothetical protein BDF21DRAFT_458577 [Thamnidium elegans]
MVQLTLESPENSTRAGHCFSIETTVRHFLDLIDSPNNPLKQVSGERTACISATIYVINQLFISNNDFVNLDWIENEYGKISQSKWDGVILKNER